MRYMTVLFILFSLLFLSVACTEVEDATPAPSTQVPVEAVEEGYPGSEASDRAAPLTATPPPPVVVPTAAPDSGVITGRVLVEGTGEPVTATPVWLAWIYWFDDAHSDGTFNLDPSVAPNTMTDSEGRFAIGSIEPRDYAVIVGQPMGVNYILTETDGDARVFTITAGQVVEAGDLQVHLAQPAQEPEMYPSFVPLYP
jgi:hypothetical protein